MNLCPQRVSSAAEDYDYQKSTAIHELLHALGFSSASWPLFRYADLTPRTTRGHGFGRRLPKKRSDCNGLEVDANTLQVTAARGTTVTLMVTPRVKSVAHDLFACDDSGQLPGAELENQPTTQTHPPLCYGSQ